MKVVQISLSEIRNENLKIFFDALEEIFLDFHEKNYLNNSFIIHTSNIIKTLFFDRIVDDFIYKNIYDCFEINRYFHKPFSLFGNEIIVKSDLPFNQFLIYPNIKNIEMHNHLVCELKIDNLINYVKI